MYRVIYMGTPDFAVPCLSALTAIGADICCVVTQPDKPVGRKQILTPSPVKRFALENGMQVYQPTSMKSDDVFAYLSAFEPDFIVVAAYGKILPKRILELPKIACVNVHGSILPKYRGSAPIQWSVINGDEQTGITTMLMNEGVDTGDILLVERTPIGENETAGELFDRLAALSPSLLIKTLDGLADGVIKPQKQDDRLASYAPMLTKDAALIDWNNSCRTVHNFIRGMNPWPCAYTVFQDKKYKIFADAFTDKKSQSPVGTLFCENGMIYAVCRDGVLHVTDLQADGCKRMSDKAYLNGHCL